MYRHGKILYHFEPQPAYNAGSSISRSTYANIESRRRNIKASDLKIIKKLFDVPYDGFFES